MGRTWKLPNGSYVLLKTGLGSRPGCELGLATAGTVTTVLVDPEASRVFRDEAEIGLLKSSWFTPSGADVRRMLTFIDCADAGMLP